MQTIKINIEKSAFGYEFCNGSISVARIANNAKGIYKLMVTNKPFGAVDTLAMAVEVISDKLESLFGSLGFNVEFN